MKLNVCSGKKRLPGYLNVDVIETADVCCDVLRLPREWENKCDEVLCVHGLEHFPPREGEQAVREWIRVLKPGGKLIVEVPCLLKACQRFANGDRTASLTMNVFYGKPMPGNIYQMHKWGYTAESLIHLFKRFGLKDAVEQPPQFHKPTRDIRVEGIK